ncbi:MAG: M48 family metallopeptidase, partial [Promethearchaeota archaeon]
MKHKIQTIKYGIKTLTIQMFGLPEKPQELIIKPNGNVIVKAPLNLLVEIKRPIPLKQELVIGEKILLKNKLIRLKIILYPKKRSKISFAFNTLYIYTNENLPKLQSENEIKRLLIKWYRQKALSIIISERIEKFLKIMDIKPKEIKIRDFKLRWGSCTKDGKLLFNWRIIMAPISAIDYVIVHELC